MNMKMGFIVANKIKFYELGSELSSLKPNCANQLKQLIVITLLNTAKNKITISFK